MDEELEVIVQKMLDAGEPEENIKLVIEEFNKPKSKKETIVETVEEKPVDSDPDEMDIYADKLTEIAEVKASDEQVEAWKAQAIEPETSFFDYFTTKTETTYPWQTYFNTAKQSLQEQNKQLPEDQQVDITTENIKNKAIDIYVSSQEDEWQTGLTNEVLEDFNDEYGVDRTSSFGSAVETLSQFSVPGIIYKYAKGARNLYNQELDDQEKEKKEKDYFGFVIDQGYKNFGTEQQKNYFNNRKKLYNKLSTKESELEKEYAGKVSDITARRQDIDKSLSELNKYEKRIKEKDPNFTEKDYKDYQNLFNNIKKEKELFNKEIDELGKNAIPSNDFETIKNLTLKTYDNLDYVVNNVSSSIVNLAGGVGTLKNELRVPELLKWAGVDIGNDEDLNKIFGKEDSFLKDIVGTYGKTSNKVGDAISASFELGNAIKGQNAPTPSIGDVDTVEDFGMYMLDLASGQAVNTAITVAVPPVGLVILSANATGSKMNEMNKEIEGIKGPDGEYIVPPKDINALQYFGTAALYGGVEYVTERVSLGILKGGMKNVQKAFSLTGKTSSNLTLKNLTNFQQFKKLGYDFGKDSFKESGAEGIVQLTNNLADMYVLGNKDVSLMDGMTDAMAAGFFMGNMYQSPNLVAGVTQSFSSEGEYAEANKLNSQLVKLSEQRNDLLRKGKDAGPLQIQIDKILDQQMQAMNKVQQRTLDMTPSDRQGMIDLYNKEHHIRAEIDGINESPDYTPEIKKIMINDLAQDLAEAEANRERIIGDATFNADIKRQSDLALQIRAENGTFEIADYIIANDANSALEQGLDAIDAKDLTDQQKSAAKAQLTTKLNDMKAKSTSGDKYQGFAWGDNIEIKNEDGSTETINIPMSFALNKDNATVASHELGHQTLFKQFIKSNPDAVGLVRDLEAYVKKNYKEAYKRFEAVRQAYANENLTKEQTAEEQLANLSDFMRQNDLKSDRTFRNKLLSKFKKIDDGNNQIETGEDVFNMLASYNQSFESGQLQGLAKAVIKGEAKVKRKKQDTKTQQQITELQDSMAQEAKKSKSPFSKSLQGETAMEKSKRQNKRNVDVKDIYIKDAVGKDNEQWREFLDSNKGSRVLGDMINMYYPDMIASAINKKAADPMEVASEAIEPLMKHIQAFNPEQNTDLAGYVGGYLGLKVGTGAKKIAKKTPTISIEKEGVREVAEKQAVKETAKEEAPVRKGIKLAERLGDAAKKISDKVKQMKPVLEGKTYKTLKDLAPNDTQEMFGIVPKPGNLTKQDVKNAQAFINKNADILLAMLPEGTTVGGKATGVQKVLLDAFYTKGRRVKAAKTGSTAGLPTQNKKPNIKISEFKEVFGITPAGQPNIADRNTSARIKALVDQTGKLLTNQAVREVTPTAPKEIAEGKSKVMFSKDINSFIQKQNFSGKVLPGDFATENKRWNSLLDKALEGSGVTKIDMKTPEGRQRFLDFAVSSGLTQKLPKSFWRSMQGTSESLILNKEDKAALKQIEKEGFKVYAEKTLRGHKGNLPFINVAEADAWINSVEKDGGKFAKESDVFNDMLKKENPRAKKLPLEKALNDPAFIKRQENSIKGLEKVFKMLEEAMITPEGVAFAGALLSSSGASQNHFIRKAAPYKFYEKGYLTQDYTQEHTLPASIVGKYLFGQALAGTVNENFNKIKNNYFQGALLNTSDVKLKGTKPNGNLFNYVEQTPEGWTLDDNIWARYFNENVETNNGGINPNSLMLAGNKSLAQEFNVDVKGVKVSSDLIQAQNKIITNQVKGEITKAYSKKLIDVAVPVIELKAKQATPANETVMNNSGVMMSKNLNNEETIRQANIMDKALDIAKDPNAPVKKIRVFDFDDTLARTKSNVLYTMADGTSGKLTAEQFAERGTEMLEQGAEFDFSEFNKVVDGKKGPLFKVAQIMADKRGTQDMFILTARAAESAPAIKQFLDALGLNIPIENITGLGDSSPLAKSGWIVGKAAEGYNDFYFADDASKNVKAVKKVLDVIDVKGKVQQAKIKFSKNVDQIFNDIIENKTGVASETEYSRARAQTAGANKGRFKFWIAPSAEDFVGLLYPLLGKGKLGDSQMAWFKKHLLDPYGRAMENISREQNRLSNDFKALKKALVESGTIPKNLNKKALDNFTFQDIARITAWHTQGMDIPGLSNSDLNKILDFVRENPGIKEFADQLIMINKGQEYTRPRQDWLAGTISTDLLEGLRDGKRSQYLQEWQANKDLIFSEKNLNKLEAVYGKNYREALENMLRRMETGSNRTSTAGRLENRLLDYVNNSVGAVMFFNMRSGVLQLLSAVNFLNWSDNNPLKAGIAFANQPQYWKDFMRLMNSDFLIDRRNGLKINVSESEIADAANNSKNKARGVISYLLQKGFTVTQVMDSFAIASGGATFYRNKLKKYKKQGLSEADAEAKAYQDFRETAEESQQSSRPDRISQQQASSLGRIILAFANTPMQYGRIMKKSFLDLKNGRGDWKSNMSKILYYGALQNILFTGMQQAMFALAFNDEEEEDEAKKKKYYKMVDSMGDNILRGLGLWGQGASTLIRIAREAIKQSQREGYPGADYDLAALELLSLSPPIDIKMSKLRQAGMRWKYEGWKHDEARWGINDPAYESAASVIAALTNFPADRIYRKLDNVQSALDSDNETWKRVANILGWSNWELESSKDRKDRIDLEKEQKKKVAEKVKIEKLTLEEKKARELEVKTKKYKDLNKAEQVRKLDSLGLTKQEIRDLKYEKDRVNKLIELMEK